MESQTDRLQSKIDRLKARVEAERRAAGPKIDPKLFESADFLTDGSIKPSGKPSSTAQSTKMRRAFAVGDRVRVYYSWLAKNEGTVVGLRGALIDVDIPGNAVRFLVEPCLLALVK